MHSTRQDRAPNLNPEPALPPAGRALDRVHGAGFAYECRLGFHEYESHIRQRVLVDFEAWTDWRRAAALDEPEAGLVDYYEVNRMLTALVEAREWRLLEAMAEAIARALCERFPVERVRVKVTKAPFDMPNTGSVAVECWRSPGDYAIAEEDASRSRA